MNGLPEDKDDDENVDRGVDRRICYDIKNSPFSRLSLSLFFLSFSSSSRVTWRINTHIADLTTNRMTSELPGVVGCN